jgi:hypothetical protein
MEGVHVDCVSSIDVTRSSSVPDEAPRSEDGLRWHGQECPRDSANIGATPPNIGATPPTPPSLDHNWGKDTEVEATSVARPWLASGGASGCRVCGVGL